MFAKKQVVSSFIGFIFSLSIWTATVYAFAQDLEVAFVNDRLTVKADSVSLEAVMQRISQAAQLEITILGVSPAPITADFKAADLEMSIRRLIRGMNSIFYYDLTGAGSREARLTEVLILSNSGNRQKTAFRPSSGDENAKQGSGATPNMEEDSRQDSESTADISPLDDIDRLSDEALTEERALYEMADLADFEADQERRLAAVEALGEIGDPQVEDTLIARALEDEDSEVRAAAVEALGSISGEESTDFLVLALEDEDADVRTLAIETLASVGGKNATAFLMQVVEDEDAQVRAAAMEALGDIGDKSATDALIAALDDADEEVQESARAAVEQMGIVTTTPNQRQSQARTN